MQDVYNYIIRDFYLSWSIRINKLFFNSEIVLYLAIGFIILILFFLLKKKRTKEIILYVSLVLIITLFIIYIPYHKGKVINEYFNNGYQTISLIEAYKRSNGNYPKQLDDLSDLLIDKDKFAHIKVGLFYKFQQNDTLNVNMNTGIHNEDYYELKLKVPNTNSPLYRFDQYQKRFLIND